MNKAEVISLQDHQFLALTKFKAFADKKFNIAQMVHSILFIYFFLFLFLIGWKHCGKGENAGYQHLLFFPWCFQKAYQGG